MAQCPKAAVAPSSSAAPVALAAVRPRPAVRGISASVTKHRGAASRAFRDASAFLATTRAELAPRHGEIKQKLVIDTSAKIASSGGHAR
eukprot:scaffold80309_cov72-Phaeocystis_antarctica.AAC.4